MLSRLSSTREWRAIGRSNCLITAVVRFDLAVFGNDFGGILSYCAFILCMVSACVRCPRRWCSGETSRFGCQVRYVRARRASDCDSLSGAHQNHGGPGFQFGIAVCSGNSSEDAAVFDTNFLRVNHVVKTRFPRRHVHRLLAVAPPLTPLSLIPQGRCATTASRPRERRECV